MRLDRRGAVLLEAIVALTILAVAGTAAVTMVAGSADAVRRARDAGDEARRADAFLQAVSLWSRDDLDRRLGVRRQGEWRMYVERPALELYEVELADSTGARVLLRTALFRPEPPSGVLEPAEAP